MSISSVDLSRTNADSLSLLLLLSRTNATSFHYYSVEADISEKGISKPGQRPKPSAQLDSTKGQRE